MRSEGLVGWYGLANTDEEYHGAFLDFIGMVLQQGKEEKKSQVDEIIRSHLNLSQLTRDLDVNRSE